MLAGLARLHAVSRIRSVEMYVLLRHVVGELSQRTDVIQNPERPPMRGDDQIIIFDHQIVHRRGGQIQFERPPLRTIVE